jgi:cation transport ATPase
LLVVTTAGITTGGVAWLAEASGVADVAWLATAACGLAYASWVAVAGIAQGRLSVDLIALVALAGAVAVGELLAAAVISVMLTSGRTLETWAAYRARHDLSALLARAPRTGRRYRDGSLETVPLEQIAAGDVLLVATGDVVPVDGTLSTGTAVLDESALTGEALPITHVQSNALRSGTLNVGAGRRGTGGGRPGRSDAMPAHPRGTGRPGLWPFRCGAPRVRGEDRRSP